MIVNLQAQEYDNLKMIDSFAKLKNPDPELKNFKINQFKQMSWVRTENEKAANVQELLKARNVYQNSSIQKTIEQ